MCLLCLCLYVRASLPKKKSLKNLFKSFKLSSFWHVTGYIRFDNKVQPRGALRSPRLIFIDFRFWVPEVRYLQYSLWSGRGLNMESEHQKPLVWCIFILWPPEVRYLNLVSSMARDGPQMGLKHFITYGLIPHLNLFNLFYIFNSGGKWHLGVNKLRDQPRSKRGLRMKLEHQQIYELIPNMTYFLWL